jgi:hypothetical protein
MFCKFSTGRSVIWRIATCHTSAICSILWYCTQINVHIVHVDHIWSCISWIYKRASSACCEMGFPSPDDGLRHGLELRRTLTQINNHLWCWPGSVWVIHTVWRQRVTIGDDIIPRAFHEALSFVRFTFQQNWKLFAKKTHSYIVWNVVMRDRRFSHRR